MNDKSDQGSRPVIETFRVTDAMRNARRAEIVRAEAQRKEQNSASIAQAELDREQQKSAFLDSLKGVVNSIPPVTKELIEEYTIDAKRRLLDIMDIDDLISSLADKFAVSSTPKDVVEAKLLQISNRLFPKNPLPAVPPELWTDKSARRFETPRAFVEDVYKPWFETELSWPYLYKNDRPVYNALRYQLKKANVSLNGYLPSKSDLVRRDLEQAGPEGLKQAMRRVKALQRHP